MLVSSSNAVPTVGKTQTCSAARVTSRCVEPTRLQMSHFVLFLASRPFLLDIVSMVNVLVKESGLLIPYLLFSLYSSISCLLSKSRFFLNVSFSPSIFTSKICDFLPLLCITNTLIFSIDRRKSKRYFASLSRI